MTEDPWHYQRRELAEQTLALLATGPAQALSLFAPRRTGKTAFLLRDLGPLADRNGHRVVYASFWQAPLSPLAVLLHSLEASLQKGTFADRVRSSLLGLAPRLKLSATMPPGGAAAEIDLTGLAGQPPGDLLLYLDDLLGRIARGRKPALLLLDEVQELGREKANQPLVAALRTSLDKRPEGLRAVFTGSSREGLKAMFSAREAPFFHFATPVDLPPLDEAFVEHLLAAFRRSAGRSLDKAAMLQAFETLHANPYFFRHLLEVMLLDPSVDAAAALETVRGRIATELGYPRTWVSLTAIQRATVAVLAHGERKPFSRQARESIGAALAEAPPSTARIQAALRKLERSGLADARADGWAVEDPEFAAWIRDRGDRV